MTGFAAQFTPETLPEWGVVRRLCLRDPGCGNRRDGIGLISQADVGVPHCHPDVAMADQITGFKKNVGCKDQLVIVIMIPGESGHCGRLHFRNAGGRPMARRYFLKRGEAVLGPFSPKKLRDLIVTKKLKGKDLVGLSDCGPWEQIREKYKSSLEGRVDVKLQRAAPTNSRRIDYRNDEAVENVLKTSMWIANISNTFLGFAIVFMFFKHGLTGFDENPFAPYLAFLGETLNPFGKTVCVVLVQGLLFIVLHYNDDWLCELFFRALEVMPRWIAACVHVPAGGYVYMVKWLGAATLIAFKGVAVVLIVGGGSAAVITIGWSLYWLFTAPAGEVSSLISAVGFWGAIILASVVALVFVVAVVVGLASNVKNVYIPMDWDGDGDNDFFVKF